MTNRKCPECEKLGRDKTGDHLFLMEDGVTWCCSKPYHALYLEKEGEVVEGKKDWGLSANEIKGLPFHGNRDRRISRDTHETFKVRTELSETDRSPVAVYYPELTDKKFMGWKKRKFPKSFSVVSTDIKGVPDYFGQWRSPKTGKRLLICAGEEDTLAAYQMLKDYKDEYDWAVVGLPRGEATSIETVTENLSFTKNFEEVILAMDMDDAGKQAIEKMIPILGPDTKTCVFSEKDISDLLVKNKAKEFLNAYYSAKEYRPANIISVSDILEESILPVKMGLSYPWSRLTDLTYGLKEKGEIIGVGAAPGAGKSTIWQQIQKHLIFEHRQKIAVFDIEEGASQGLKKLIGSCLNLPIHKPDCVYNIEEARAVGTELEGLVSFYGGDSENWDEVEAAVRYFAAKGIRFFFIDPLSALVEHLSASDGNTELGRIMRSMRKLRKHQELTFFHANHLNNPNTGKAHGEGGKVLGSQFSGSRAQWKYSTLLLGFERNQQADDPRERNDGVLRVIKDRMGGNTGPVSMRYNTDTGNLEQTEVDISEFIGESDDEYIP